MLLINRAITFLAPIFIFVIFELLFKYQEKLYLWMFLLALAIVLSLFRIVGRNRVTKWARWNFLMSILFFCITAFLYILFMDNYLARHIMAGVVSFLAYIFYENLFVYLYNNKRYVAYSLENISNYFNLLSAFFFYSVLFALKIFLNFPLAALAFMSVCFTPLLFYHVMWINKAASKKIKLYVVAVSLITSELLLACVYLPTSFYLNGSILAAAYYFMVGIGKANFLDNLTPRLLKFYSLVSVLVFISILATAKWF